MNKKFVTYLLIFFIPVVLGTLVVEKLTRELPSSYAHKSKYLEANAEEIEIIVLGSSQMAYGINPEWLDVPGIILASGYQHHDTDFKLLQHLLPRLINLETVVLEVSFQHFELPHNGKDFWKNSIYKMYYGVNCFERNTYFKDNLTYLSNPKFFSKKIIDFYSKKGSTVGFNQFGFDTLNFSGVFKNLEFNEEIIANGNFKFKLEPTLKLFLKNSDHFIEIVNYLELNNMRVIIVSPPLYKSFLLERNKVILNRRDSLVKSIIKSRSKVHWLNFEDDIDNFKITHYKDKNHLNPDGAAIFTKLFAQKLDSLD